MLLLSILQNSKFLRLWNKDFDILFFEEDLVAFLLNWQAFFVDSWPGLVNLNHSNHIQKTGKGNNYRYDKEG